MPSPSKFMVKFQLRAVAARDGWTLKVNAQSHEEVEKFQSYRLNFSVTLTPKKNASTKQAVLKDLASVASKSSKQPIVVKSRWGTPYACKITKIRVLTGGSRTAQQVQLEIAGAANRIR